MRHSVRLRAAAACCTFALATACSDSTGPNNSQDPSHIAAHFDSLYVDIAALAETSDGYSFRATALSLVELIAAYGGSTHTVSVTTANGTEQWQALELEDIEPANELPLDTTFFVVAYRESAAHTIALVDYDEVGNIYGGTLITNDTLVVSPSDGDGATIRTSLGDGCATPSASLSNPQLAMIADYSCELASFSTSMSLVVPATENMDPALTSLSFPTTTLSGELVTLPADTQARVHRLLVHLRDLRANRRR